MLSLLWSSLLTALAWLPLQVVGGLRRLQLGRRGVVRVCLGGGGARSLQGKVQNLVALRGMAQDKHVRAVVVELRELHLGWATLQDLRQALDELRESGKLVVLHLDTITSRELFLAVAADRVWVTPSAEVFLSGVAARMVFYGDALQRLGVKVEIEAAGEFKSFGEPWSRAWPTAANRSQVRQLVEDLHGQLLDGIAEGRRVERAVIEDLMERSPLPAEDVARAGLVDGAVYADQARRELAELLDVQPDALSFRRYAVLAWMERLLAGYGQRHDRVVVLHLEGPVVHGAEPTGGAGLRIDADRVVPVLDRLAVDERVRAIVLYVDSPGGSALASDLIARSVGRAVQRKPVVAVMGDVCASGGYYLAAPSRELVARPGTITGSIGVVAGKLVLGPVLGTFGVHAEVVSAGSVSGMFDTWDPLTPDQRARLRSMLDRAYDRFLKVVSAGRRLPLEAVDAVARGRVWTGARALEVGLVDHLGGLDLGLRRARSLAGLPQVPGGVVYVHFPPPRLRVLRAILRRDQVKLDPIDILAQAQGASAGLFVRMLRDHPGEALALLPWDIDLR